MIRIARVAALLAATATLSLAAAAAAPAATPAPDLDCSIGFQGLLSWAPQLSGAETDPQSGVIRIGAPDEWRIEFAFSRPGEPAHPAATMRKFVKQVTGVWTAQSKGCGYGDQSAFVALMADMKAVDKQLTDASRDAAEKAKREASPLAPGP